MLASQRWCRLIMSKLNTPRKIIKGAQNIGVHMFNVLAIITYKVLI